MSECVLWEKGADSSRYGSVYVNGKQVGAHKKAYEDKHGGEARSG